MLHVVGAATLDDLAARAVPETIRSNAALDLPDPVDEAAAIVELRALAAQNTLKKSLIGLGYYGTVTPPVILGAMPWRTPAGYTAYTPYQAEIAQGRLEGLLNFQTMVRDLTGMQIANASLLDEATAAAEAMAMAHGLSKMKSDVLAVAEDLHPQTLAVIRTRAKYLGINVQLVPPGDPAAITAAAPFAVVLQYPSTTGEVRDLAPEIAAVHAAGGLGIVATDLLALALLTPPGTMDADIVVGSAQRFGKSQLMGFEGPHAGFFATRDSFKRAMPGRLVGVSLDTAGQPAMRLALQTREQHIRREKATSNICTAQVLLAVIAGFYAVWHGPSVPHQFGASRCRPASWPIVRCGPVFACGMRRSSIPSSSRARLDLVARVAAAGFNLRQLDAIGVAIALDETVTREDLLTLAALLGAEFFQLHAGPQWGLLRNTPFLAQSVFSQHHAEPEMLRYLKRLEDR